MAAQKSPQEIAAAEEKKKLQDEKRQLKNEQKAQKKEAKRRAKEIAKKENELDDEDEGGGIGTFLITLFIVALWLVVIVVVIKMDVGGFGSSVLTPVLKDVPVLNRILPGNSLTETADKESYGGYTSLRDAVDQIERLEKQLEQVQNENQTKDADLNTLKAEVLRLQEFEKKQVDFQRIRNEFYEEVIYAENGPGPEEYLKYYESMDPTTAEFLYKQVVAQQEEDKKVQEYASTYAQMKPKAAAAVFEKMTGDLQLVADILQAMNAESRANIMNAIDPEVGAKLTKIMNPES
ncbi:MAG: hypothetical protein IJ747_07090 [Lachnospiraceae bacterium]|nr:hypothetical protein [Lachnospiraceae bacterium]